MQAWYSRQKIEDEFTDLPVSRFRKYQLRKVKRGLCRMGGCQNSCMEHSEWCEECLRKHDERRRVHHA